MINEYTNEHMVAHQIRMDSHQIYDVSRIIYGICVEQSILGRRPDDTNALTTRLFVYNLLMSPLSNSAVETFRICLGNHRIGCCDAEMIICRIHMICHLDSIEMCRTMIGLELCERYYLKIALPFRCFSTNYYVGIGFGSADEQQYGIKIIRGFQMADNT